MHFFIDTVAHMYNLETAVISAGTRCIYANKTPFLAFCGIKNALAVLQQAAKSNNPANLYLLTHHTTNLDNFIERYRREIGGNAIDLA